jgi:hypothetical protein
VNTTGAFTCTCPSGYTGNGIGTSGCVDVDECSLDTDNCDDAPDACVNKTGSFSCSCPSGYTGSGVGTSGCADVDECASNNGGCDSNALCTNTPGSRSCACKCGYTGNGLTCSANAVYSGYGPPAMNTAPASSLSHGILYGHPVTLPASNLLNFGIISGSNTGKVRFALYTDKQGSPDKLVAQSGMSGTPLMVGTMFALSASACAAIPAGNYWMFLLSDTDFDIAAESNSSSTTNLCYVTGFAFSNAFPSTASACTGKVASNYMHLFVLHD